MRMLRLNSPVSSGAVRFRANSSPRSWLPGTVSVRYPHGACARLHDIFQPARELLASIFIRQFGMQVTGPKLIDPWVHVSESLTGRRLRCASTDI